MQPQGRYSLRNGNLSPLMVVQFVILENKMVLHNLLKTRLMVVPKPEGSSTLGAR